MNEFLIQRVWRFLEEGFLERCVAVWKDRTVNPKEDEEEAFRIFAERVLPPPGFKSNIRTDRALFDWLLFHYRRAEDRTSLFQRIRSKVHFEDPLEQEVWDAYQDSLYRLWEVVKPEPGRGATLGTLFGPYQEEFVPDPSLCEFPVGTFFFTRLFKVRGLAFTGSFSFTMGQEEVKEEFLKLFEVLFSRYYGNSLGKGEIDFFREWEDEIVTFQFQLLDPSRGDLPWDDYDEHNEEEARKEFERDFLPAYYATWWDLPLPALLGETPREARKTATGRSRLGEVLEAMEGERAEFRGPVEPIERLQKELGREGDPAARSGRLYTLQELRQMIRLARDFNIVTLRYVELKLFTDITSMLEGVRNVNRYLAELADQAGKTRQSAEVQGIARHVLDIEAESSRVRYFLERPSIVHAKSLTESEAFEEYSVRMESGFLNREFRALEDDPITLDVTLRELLMLLPEEMVEAAASAFEIERRKGELLAKAIAARYRSREDLLIVRNELKSSEQEALDDLLGRGGWMKYPSFVRKYGKDAEDFWHWGALFPTEILSVLRYYLLVWVGKHPKHGKIVVVPEDLRMKF